MKVDLKGRNSVGENSVSENSTRDFADQMFFSTVVPGKWILAGEHSVLRGVPALVFPLNSDHALKLSYVSTKEPLSLVLKGAHGAAFELLVWGVLEKASQKLKKARADWTGQLTLESSIPLGSGLGASAALCVAITRWLHFLGLGALHSEDQIYEFARNLEDLFHGESSGVDIAVSQTAMPLFFVRGGERKSLKQEWFPQLYLSYSGQRGVTRDCVNQVKALFLTDLAKAEDLDRRMAEAVSLSLKALFEQTMDSTTDVLRMKHLRQAIDLAYSCFLDWGLCEGLCGQHMEELKRKGAIAVKPTGSGGGGYVVSLWESEPPAELFQNLIPLFKKN